MPPPGDDKGRAIVVGHGRVGQIVCDMLERHRFPFIATDRDPAAVDRVPPARARGLLRRRRQSGVPQELRPAWTRRAVIVTIHDQAAIDEIVRVVRALRPDMLIVSRARDATHARHLYAIGVTDAVPETIEASLQLSEAALVGLGAADRAGDRLHPREARRVPPRAAGGGGSGGPGRDALHPRQDAAAVVVGC